MRVTVKVLTLQRGSVAQVGCVAAGKLQQRTMLHLRIKPIHIGCWI